MHPSDDDSGASMEMPRYRSHKQVWALEIATVVGRYLTFRDAGYAGVMCPEPMFSRYTPVPGDFYVVYDDGYKSFSPAKAFNEGYTRIRYYGASATSSLPGRVLDRGSGTVI